MPLDIGGEIVGGALRVVGHVIAEVVFEFLIKGAGYLMCRPFSRRVNPDSGVVVCVGLLFWAGVILFAYVSYRSANA